MQGLLGVLLDQNRHGVQKLEVRMSESGDGDAFACGEKKGAQQREARGGGWDAAGRGLVPAAPDPWNMC